VGEVCFYYNSDQQGSVSDFAFSIEDYGTSQPGCYDFKGPGAGQGECIKNNAASVENRTAAPVTVYFNSGHKGDTEVIPAGASVNLDEFKNKNASHSIGG
jgi:M23/M37 peptidase domain protein